MPEPIDRHLPAEQYDATKTNLASIIPSFSRRTAKMTHSYSP